MPRLGKKISPKRASVEGYCSNLSSSRLGERSSHGRESLSPEQDLLAWARVGRDDAWILFPSLFLGCLIYVWLDCYAKIWNEWICLSKRMYELWMVDLNDSWHEMNMKWLLIEVTWYWYETQFLFMVWEGWFGMDSTVDMVEDLVVQVGMRIMCMINITWLIEYDWSVVSAWSHEPLGETSWSCFSGRDVIPWPLLVGVHGGAPSI